jgi:uncharacterized membrane protein
MAFCTNCGANIPEGSNSCPACGKDVNAAGTGTPQYQPQPQQQYYAGGGYSQASGPQADYADIQENKGLSILCYFGLLLLIPLLTKPNSAYIKYHSNQGLVLLLFAVACSIVSVIPILGWIVGIVGSIFTLVCLIIGIINAAGGKMKPLPLIGSISILK